jgi:hypothetical protein
MATTNSKSKKGNKNQLEVTDGASEEQLIRAAEIRAQIEKVRSGNALPLSPRSFTDVGAEDAEKKSTAQRKKNK